MKNQEIEREELELLLTSCMKDIEKLCNSAQGQLVDDNIAHTLNLFSDEDGYHYLEKLRESEKNIEKEFGDEVRVLVNRALVYRSCVNNFHKIDSLNFPQDIRSYIKEDFFRVLKYANDGKSKFLSFQDAQFFKYMETVQFKLIPLGNQGVSTTGFPRCLIWRQSPLSGLKFCILLLRMGGNRPFFETHFNPHRRRQFNAEGWDSMFQRAAQILERKPEIKGVFGAAWFFDPALESISPELGYIRDIVKKVGGHFFYAGKNEEDRKNAFFMSAARKNAYDEGRYDPAKYIAIIPRKALIAHYGMKQKRK